MSTAKWRWLRLNAAAALVSINVVAQDGSVPCWRGMPGSTFQGWAFNSDATPVAPEASANPYGNPLASIVPDPLFGTGWYDHLSGFGANTGFWDLGRNGTITLTIPNRPDAPANSVHYIWVRTTEWSFFPERATISVEGAVSLDSGELTPPAEQQWVTYRTKWRLGPNASPDATVLVTAAFNGTVIDEVVVDTICIEMPCPPDIQVNADLGQCGKENVTWPLPELDGCTVADIACMPPNGSAFPVGSTPVTCVLRDAAGGAVNCSFNVIVADANPPIIACPPNLTVAAEPGQCSAGANVGAPAVMDACDPSVTVAWFRSDDEDDIAARFRFGITIITWYAFDAAGNSSSCEQTVTVTDGEMPIIAGCPGSFVAAADAGDCDAVVIWPAPTALDGCEGSVPVACQPPSGSTFTLGVTSVTCTARDAAGNTSQCVFEVTVVDQEPPLVRCPADIAVAQTGSGGAVTSFQALAGDNCGVVTAVCTPPSGSIFPSGSTIVTCTATDAAGNTGSCSFRVTVGGQTPRGTKTQVRDQMVALLATIQNSSDRNKLQDAINHLNKSLDSANWLDASHPKSSRADRLFNEESQTVTRLKDLRNSNRSGIPAAVFQSFIDRLVGVDRTLATIAIDEAVARGGNTGRIDGAREELSKGDAEASRDRPDKAIDRYRNSWKQANSA